MNLRRNVHEIAPELIGAQLLFDGVGGTIVEVEAYDHEDPAAHGYGNRRTERNASMFLAGRCRFPAAPPRSSATSTPLPTTSLASCTSEMAFVVSMTVAPAHPMFRKSRTGGGSAGLARLGRRVTPRFTPEADGAP